MKDREQKIKVVRAIQEKRISRAEAKEILQAIEQEGLLFKTTQGETGEEVDRAHALMAMYDKAGVEYIHIERVMYAK